MRVITFASFKGGSGKTTTAIATAAALVDGGRHRVFVLNLDNRQNSLFRWLNDIRRVYADEAPGRAVLDGAAIQPDIGDREATREMLDHLKGASANYDICIIDTQGTQNPVSISAMQYSDLVLIPFQVSGIEIEPFLATYKVAQTTMRTAGAKVVGLSTRMPNIASTTMTRTREVLERYSILTEDGTSQRDGYQQLVYEGGTFGMIHAKFEAAATSAADGKARRRARNECPKIETARDDTLAMLARLSILDEAARKDTT